MLQRLINHSPDLKRLRDEGYELERRGGYLCIHQVPYVNSDGRILRGTLIGDITFTGEQASPPASHTVHFMGEVPCHKDGQRMDEIIHSSPNQDLGNDLMGNHYFSSKPPSGRYDDHYERFTRYVALLSAPAKSIDPSVSALTFKPFVDDEDEVFHYFDSSSSRANIARLSEIFENQRIAIIGLGGSGSYILDFVSKTCVAEIHLFDADVLSQHNAFRSPGAPSLELLLQAPSKVDYFQGIYSNMHKRIVAHREFITEQNVQMLAGFDYIFICVDRNSVRSMIAENLANLGVAFIDVGLGINIQDGKLVGTIRTTASDGSKIDHLVKRISSEDVEDNDYATNIQIADLNATNACKAVEKWKKMCGFYLDEVGEFHSTYTISAGLLVNGDFQK